MKELGVESLDTKKKKNQKEIKMVIPDDASDISKAVSDTAKNEVLLEKTFGSKYMSAKAVIGGEDRGPNNLGSPRELAEEVQPVGEKQYYKGVHEREDKGLIIAHEDLIPETDRELDLEEKLRRKK